MIIKIINLYLHNKAVRFIKHNLIYYGKSNKSSFNLY